MSVILVGNAFRMLLFKSFSDGLLPQKCIVQQGMMIETIYHTETVKIIALHSAALINYS